MKIELTKEQVAQILASEELKPISPKTGDIYKLSDNRGGQRVMILRRDQCYECSYGEMYPAVRLDGSAKGEIGYWLLDAFERIQ